MSDSPTEFDTGLTRADLDSKQARFVNAPWGEFALYESDGQLYCASAFCPHMEGPLFEGSVIAGIVTCPWHSWRFSLESGELVSAEDCEEPCSLTICQIRIGANDAIVLLAPKL